ncbi:hypothetical protein [Bacillus andreraoultii]|uniref:hypothetical protein n=1 Tax=Bacillus andreraoultii TaxID=1499685 RepID=UPI000539BEFE|nr:hypothetical protein [Bacillus andreraoultii]
MNILHMEDYLIKLKQQLKMRHYLYYNGSKVRITMGENWLFNKSFHINFRYLYTKDDLIVTNLSISNLTDERIRIKLFVETFLNELKNNYIFVSPKKDVLFLTNNDGLYLTSGIMNGRSLAQYGVLNKDSYEEKIQDGIIPFNPIGSGNCIGLFSLEQELEPYEATVANTWTLASNSYSERDLFHWDSQLKSRLAFSKK